MTEPNTPSKGGAAGPPLADSAEPVIAATLTERLRCAACGYDLRGLSVLDRCPECGMRIATSILAVVDPRAQEFEPIRKPRWIAVGLLAWALGALFAAACAWLQRAAELPALANAPSLLSAHGARTLAWAGAMGIVVSGLGAIALVRPSRRMGPRGCGLAIAGVLLYAPLALTYLYLHAWLDAGLASVYFGRLPDPTRVGVRSVELLLIVGIVLLLRQNARELAARSAILRTGRVDRQTMYAVAVCAALGIVGDGIRLAAIGAQGALAEVLGIAGVSIVVLASVLLTMGLCGVTIDCVRIARALLRSGRRLASLVTMVEVAHVEPRADTAS